VLEYRIEVEALVRIKQAVLSGRVIFTRKADLERDSDDLTVQEVYESIINAHAIDKTLRSTSPHGRGDKMYVIKGLTFANILVYTKGVLRKEPAREVFYVLVSAKCSE
jgi:hypothetical protein